MTTYYKFLNQSENGEIKSHFGDHTWTVGTTYTAEGPLEDCVNGFHASSTPLQALSFVKGNVLATVTTGDEIIASHRKINARQMTIEKAYKWTKTDSVALAVFAANLVIDIFENRYPQDTRPRKAIEAAQQYLDNPSRENSAAYYTAYASYYADAAYAASASAAASAASAAAAYYAAAYYADAAAAAAYAAEAAYAASASAADADAASAAAYAASAGAYAASVYAAASAKINSWIINRDLEEI